MRMFLLVLIGLSMNALAQGNSESVSKSATKRTELLIYPASVQLNSKYVSHQGVSLGGQFHLSDRIAVYASGQYYYAVNNTKINADLLQLGTEVSPPNRQYMQWTAEGGVEFTVLDGKGFVMGNPASSMQFYVNGGAGVASTGYGINGGDFVLRLRTGEVMHGALGAGIRFNFFESLGLRVELRDVIFLPGFNRVNGCNVEDLRSVDNDVKSGRELSEVTVGKECRLDEFSNGLDERKRDFALNSARGDLEIQKEAGSSGLSHQLGLYVGLSYLF